MPGTAYVDDVNAPTKAICRFEMSWTYISDDADLPWIEEVLGQLVKTTWMQVIWVPERKGNYPLKDISKHLHALKNIVTEVLPMHSASEQSRNLKKRE